MEEYSWLSTKENELIVAMFGRDAIRTGRFSPEKTSELGWSLAKYLIMTDREIRGLFDLLRENSGRSADKAKWSDSVRQEIKSEILSGCKLLGVRFPDARKAARVHLREILLCRTFWIRKLEELRIR